MLTDREGDAGGSRAAGERVVSGPSSYASPMYTDCASLRSYINNRVITSLAGFVGRQPSTHRRGDVTLTAARCAVSGEVSISETEPNEEERLKKRHLANHTPQMITFRDVTASSSQSGHWKGP